MTTSTTRILLLSLLLLLTSWGGEKLCAQKPSQIYDLIVEKKIEKAVERRNKVYDSSKKSELLLIDLCDCLLFNTPEYTAYDPEKSYDIFNRALLPNSKERTLIRFLDKKENSLDSIRVQIERNLYNLACQTNSEESYAHFIELCPQSRWAEEAAGRQEEIAYRQAIEKGTIEGYNHFLAHYATSPHVVEITQLADKTTFAQLDNTIEAYKQFIELYPQSALIEEAHNRIYRLAYAEARKAGHDDINMDLIAGLPADTPEGFRRTLDTCLTFGADNITVHTLTLKRASRIVIEDQKENDYADVAAMLEKCHLLAEAGYRPYYLYRQKNTLQNLENVGWCKPGYECLYNIYIMEEVHTILSAGAGGSTKLVAPGARHGKIERIFNYKYPTEYIDRFDTILARKEGVKQFYDQYPSCGESARPQAHGGV